MADPTHEPDVQANLRQRKRFARRTALLLLAVVVVVYSGYIYMYCCRS